MNEVVRERRSWMDAPTGLVHAVTIEARRCVGCGGLHVAHRLVTDCGIDLDVVHEEYAVATCVACGSASWLDELGETLVSGGAK